MSKRNTIALIIIIISLIFLVPGLWLPILSLEIGADVPLVGRFELYNETQSILTTIQRLHEDGSTFVAILILLFSVIVPVAKAAVLMIALFAKNLKSRAGMHKFVGIIGKWSMADVFVVGVFLSFLATRSNEAINANLHEGFYYFLAYCIISIIGIQVLKIEKPES